jgi:protein TonB
MLGDKLDIMKTGWLNVVFANRNQAYGAYQLRKDNARTTNKALVIALTLFIVATASPTIANIIRGVVPEPIEKIIDVNTITDIKKPTVTPPITPPEAHENARPHNDMIRSLPPVVKPDDLAEEPPTDKQLQEADPGPKTLTGDPNAKIDLGESHGTADPNPGITEAPSETSVFTAVEIEPSPMGGLEKFYSFLGNKIKYPTAAKDVGTQGRVVLTFVVEKDGSLTDIKALRDPGNGLGDEAIRVLKLAPHWNPGIQNGKKVRVQYTIPVNFSLADQ